MSATQDAARSQGLPPPLSAGRGRAIAATIARFLLPILLALAVGAVILLLLGTNPLTYYSYVIKRGLFSWLGLQATVTRMAPLLMIAAGLIVAFRAGIWNLGADGQFLLSAVITAALAPALIGTLPDWLTILLCFVVAGLVGAAWSLVPAFLKVTYGINEIISTLMMSFLGISFANVLVKLLFFDPGTTVPQTHTLPVEDRLPRLFGSTIHSGILIALAAVLIVHFVMTRTSFGLKLCVVGANPRAAIHAGLNVGLLTYATFAISAGLVGLGGAVDILGVWGSVRADWNPSFGLLVVPLVFLARFHGIATIAFVMFFAVLQVGGESAAVRVGVPTFYTLVLVALLLIFLALVEYLDYRRQARTKS
jgi:general nucleoside transport system permease protein